MNERMKKKELLELIKTLKIDLEEFWTLSSSSLVLRDIYEDAGDLDIAVTNKGLEQLKENYNIKFKENGWFVVSEKIEGICKGKKEQLEYQPEKVGEYYVQNIKEYYEYLCKSEREKDKKRIPIVEKYLKEHTRNMKNYANQTIEYYGCPGCAYAKHEFELPCGMAYENENFNLSQDWELPIEGFFILSPKRHIEKLSELTDEERNEMFELLNKTIKILRENNICDRFEIIFEEKENRHFHIWIMPRQKWMTEQFKDIITNIGKIFDYAKENFRTKETYYNIETITRILREELKNNKKLIHK